MSGWLEEEEGEATEDGRRRCCPTEGVGEVGIEVDSLVFVDRNEDEEEDKIIFLDTFDFKMGEEGVNVCCCNCCCTCVRMSSLPVPTSMMVLAVNASRPSVVLHLAFVTSKVSPVSASINMDFGGGM